MFQVTRLKPVNDYEDADVREASPQRMDAMDVDGGFDDFGEGTSHGTRRVVVTPGEVITSSKEYMR